MPNNKDLIDRINKEVGDSSALQYGNSPAFDPQYLSTGLRNLDTALGGGLRKGSFVLVTGEFSSGKTLLAQYFMREAQKDGLPVAYIDAERAFHRTWAQQSGVDIEKLMVSQTVRGEKAFNIVHALIRNHVGLVVVDSLAALITTAQAEAGMEQQFVGAKARMINTAIEKTLDAMEEAKADTIIIAVNQYRATVGGGPGAPKQTTPGGGGQSFYAHLWLKVRRAGWVNVKSRSKAQKYPQKTGFVMAVEVYKSKQSMPFQTVRIPFDFQTQLDEIGAIVFEAMDYGLIAAHGSYYDLDGQRFQGRAALLDYVRDKPELVDRLAEALMDKEELGSNDAAVEEEEGEDGAGD